MTVKECLGCVGNDVFPALTPIGMFPAGPDPGEKAKPLQARA